jgi:hypothetical protein
MEFVESHQSLLPSMMRVYTTMMHYRWALCRSEHSRLVAAVADCGLLLKCFAPRVPPRTEVISLTIFDGAADGVSTGASLASFRFFRPLQRFNGSTVRVTEG